MQTPNPEQEAQDSWEKRFETRKTWKEENEDLKVLWDWVKVIIFSLAGDFLASLGLSGTSGETDTWRAIMVVWIATFPLTTSVAILTILLITGYFKYRHPFSFLVMSVIVVYVAVWVGEYLAPFFHSLHYKEVVVTTSELPGLYGDFPQNLIRYLFEVLAVFVGKYSFPGVFVAFIVGVLAAWSIQIKILPHLRKLLDL